MGVGLRRFADRRDLVVRGHADNLESRSGSAAQVQTLADGALAGPEPSRERLVDDHGPLARRRIGCREPTPLDDWNPERREVLRGYARVLDREATVLRARHARHVELL